MRQPIELGEYAPDRPPSGNPGLLVAKNVYSYSGGYRPVGAFSNAAAVLSATVTGFHSDRRVNGDIITFAGTSTGLHWLNGGTAWTDKSLAAYAMTSPWDIVRFKDFLFAVGLGNQPQKWDLKTAFDPSAGGNKWANVITTYDGGAVPQFKYACVCKSYIICGFEYDGTLYYDQRIRWCARDDFTNFASAPATTGSDKQDIPSGGPIQKLVGGEFALVFQERAIQRVTPTADTSIIFQIDTIEQNRGALTSGSVVKQGNLAYFLSEDGFFVTDGSASTPIGQGKVDKTFFNDLSYRNIANMKAAADPYNKLIVWAYPSKSSDNGKCDKALAYNYAENTWTTLDLGTTVEFMGSGISAGYTLDQIANIFSSLDQVRPPLDDSFWQGGWGALFFFDTTHRMGVLRGDSLATQITTGDFQLGDESLTGRKKLTRYVRPGLDSDTASVRVGSRDNLSDSASYSASATQNSRGIAKARTTGRFHRIEITSAAASDYETQKAVEVEFELAGDQ